MFILCRNLLPLGLYKRRGLVITQAQLLAVYLTVPQWGQNGTIASGAKRD